MKVHHFPWRGAESQGENVVKIISFNVNGIRATTKKTFESDILSLLPDVLLLQETKASVSQTKAAIPALMAEGYFFYGNESKARKGYSGTAILTKTKPLSVSYDMGVDEHDQEGRVITAEYDDFYVVCVYTPNSGSELLRLPYRKTWDRSFLTFMKKLEAKKPVIVGGDLNVAHQAMDLARPEANYNKSAGYTQDEIDGMDNYLAAGFVDSFRFKHPDKVKYSWWSYRAQARARNVGWRIDYFLCSEALKPRIKEADILNNVMGSDHCPIQIELA